MVSIDFTKEWDLIDVALKTSDSDDLLYANRNILAAYSPFFKKLLFGDNAEQDVVNLDGIDYWPMLEILKILHNVDRRFDEAIPLYLPDKFVQLRKTADSYDIPLIQQLCNQQKPKLSSWHALEVAILSGFHEEKSEILENMSSRDIQKYLDKGGSDLVFTQKEVASILHKSWNEWQRMAEFRIHPHYSLTQHSIPKPSLGPEPSLISIDFTKEWEMSDIVLKMKDGEELFANKANLAVHSSFFKTLFFAESEKPKQEAVELKDVDFSPMRQILEIIHHVNRRFDEATPIFPVQDLVQFWKIASDYDIPLILKLCRQQIPKLAAEDGLEMAIKRGLRKQTTKILKKMSFKDIQEYLAKGITELVFSPEDAMVIIEKRKEVEKTLIEQAVTAAVQAEKKNTEQAIKALEAEKAKRGNMSTSRYSSGQW